MDKENIDPEELTGIIKHYDERENRTMPILGRPIERINRRVSFAPEVTLHKIDLVPRRETIGYFYDSSSRDSSRDGSRDGSRESSQEDSGSSFKALRVDEVDLTKSFTRVALNSPSKLNKLAGEGEVEEDMEFTGPIKPFEHEEEDMELTKPIQWVEFKTLRNPSSEEEMEFTQPIQSVEPITKPVLKSILEETNQEEEEMEFTQPVFKFQEPITKPQEEEMEITQPVFKLQEPITKPQEEEMEFTQPISKPQELIVSKSQEEEMEFTQPIIKPQETESVSKPQEDEMELTQPISSNQQSYKQKPFRLSTPITLNMNKEIAPHFPEVQIPIPIDLSSRLSDNKRPQPQEFDGSQPHKLPKMDISTTKIPLAEPEEDEQQEDPNYINVSLSQFLEDLGIKFYDDLEINNLDRLSISTSINEEFSFNDYVKAANKLLVYSLFEFSNKELINNITEGKTIYNQLNESILTNNPKLFKEFYGANDNEKLVIKSEFLLIKDFSRFQANKVWYNWRIQLLENLLVQMDEKYDTLCQDKAMLLSDLDTINQQFNSNWEQFQNLKTKLSKVSDFKQIYNSYSSQEIANIKSELINIKTEIKTVQAKIIEKLQELENIKAQISQNQLQINQLNQEIKSNKQKVEDNKNYEVNEIKCLNLKFKILQNLTSIKYLSKIEDTISFQFKQFQIDIDFTQSKFNLALLNNNFHNKWLGEVVIQTFNQLADNSFIDKCKKLNEIVSIAEKIDLDIFKISCKFPIVHNTDNSFIIRYFSPETKLKANFTVQLPNVLEYPKNVRVQTEIIKGDPKDTKEDLLSKLIKDCYSSNELFNNLHSV